MANNSNVTNNGRPPKLEAYDHASNKEKRDRAEGFKAVQAVSKLACPKTLSPLARKEWKRVMRLYKTMEASILCDLDITSLSMYCEAYATWQTAQNIWIELSAKEKLTQREEAKLMRNIKLMNTQTQIVTRLAEQLCLTPVGRIRMGMGIAKQASEKDALAEFLNL